MALVMLIQAPLDAVMPRALQWTAAQYSSLDYLREPGIHGQEQAIPVQLHHEADHGT
ncbi:hypothetical protein KQ313_11925 [Synechococcus sp. CS-1325]|uniref:hypothetical protein n=1 Tax=Synechococcus sp. CS-1325 TaxID=2847979 RepID=UPI00223BD8AE|nr:hypothetical protein [Synechococcus sp. CS-1325]MCT0200384.1 hypothetical protein [Synechococcus sp. CS-1325]